MALYLTVIAKTPTGYSAHCPDLPGCAAVGQTVDEVVVNMKDALELHLEGIVEDGDPLPKAAALDAYRIALNDPDLADCLIAHIPIDTEKFAASA